MDGFVPGLRVRIYPSGTRSWFLIVRNRAGADSDALFAHGHRRKQAGSAEVAPPGLVALERECHPPDVGFATRGLSINPDRQRITLVASVPLTQDDWRPLAEGEVIAVSQGEILLRAL